MSRRDRRVRSDGSTNAKEWLRQYESMKLKLEDYTDFMASLAEQFEEEADLARSSFDLSYEGKLLVERMLQELDDGEEEEFKETVAELREWVVKP